MSTQKKDLKAHHSFYISKTPKPSHYNDARKSDIQIPAHNKLSYTGQGKAVSAPSSVKNKRTEYYKRYEHDELPVKDNASYVIRTDNGDFCSLTDSHLDRLETSVFNNMSTELQTDDNSMSKLESHIKFFKTTVQVIFDNFITSMRDYDLYKRKLNEILSKYQGDSLAEMEDFIKDMRQHVMSSETSLANESCKAEFIDTSDASAIEGTQFISNSDSAALLKSLHSVVEAYKNDNYLTDSTVDNMKTNNNTYKKEETFNIFLLRGLPCVEIRMNDRQLLSEINIKHSSVDEMSGNVASAENIKKLAAKKVELENYVRQQQELPDRDIPVKVSFPKKNIHLNEDFACEKDVPEKSFISKICSYLCKKLRKNSLS